MDLPLRGAQTLSAAELQRRLGVDPAQGLSSREARERLHACGQIVPMTGNGVNDARAQLLGLTAALVLQLRFSQWTPMHAFFGTAPLSLEQWLLCAVAIPLMIPVAVLANRLDRLVPTGS